MKIKLFSKYMSKRYYNKGNRYNNGYYNGNDYNYGYDYNNKNYNNYNNYGGGKSNYNQYYDNNNEQRSNNYYKNKNSNYDRYNYNGVNTKYKEKKYNYQNKDYFKQKFNQEIKNDIFEEDSNTKVIISSCLQEKDDNINDDGEVIIYENKSTNEEIAKDELVENDENNLLDEFYNKYMGTYEKKIEIDDMEKYCKEVNEREVMKGELSFKDNFQKNKTNNGSFNPRDYEIFKVVHGVDKRGTSTKIIDFSFNKKGIEENNLYLNNPEYFSYFRRGFSLYELNDKLIILRKGLIKFNELPYDFYKIYGKNKYELFFDYKDSEEKRLEKKNGPIVHNTPFRYFDVNYTAGIEEFKSLVKKQVGFDFKDMGNNTIYVKVKEEDYEQFCLFMQQTKIRSSALKSFHEINENVYSGALQSLDSIVHSK